ncbi:uncharacterized protein ACBT57_005873 [Dama dama]
MMQRGKKFITPLMKSDLTAASINCLKLGPASPLTKKVTETLDVHTDWMGEGWPCASSAPGPVLRCPGTYTDLLAFPPARSTASSPGSSASSSPDPGLGPARPGRRLQFLR